MCPIFPNVPAKPQLVAKIFSLKVELVLIVGKGEANTFRDGSSNAVDAVVVLCKNLLRLIVILFFFDT